MARETLAFGQIFHFTGNLAFTPGRGDFAVAIEGGHAVISDPANGRDEIRLEFANTGPDDLTQTFTWDWPDPAKDSYFVIHERYLVEDGDANELEFMEVEYGTDDMAEALENLKRIVGEHGINLHPFLQGAVAMHQTGSQFDIFHITGPEYEAVRDLAERLKLRPAVEKDAWLPFGDIDWKPRRIFVSRDGVVYPARIDGPAGEVRVFRDIAGLEREEAGIDMDGCIAILVQSPEADRFRFWTGSDAPPEYGGGETCNTCGRGLNTVDRAVAIAMEIYDSEEKQRKARNGEWNGDSDVEAYRKALAPLGVDNNHFGVWDEGAYVALRLKGYASCASTYFHLPDFDMSDRDRFEQQVRANFPEIARFLRDNPQD